MRLADFISANVEGILAEWEVFARNIWPVKLIDPANDPAALRDDAEALLRATAADMKPIQTPKQRVEKSKGGGGEGGAASNDIDRASKMHGAGRVASGFALWGVVAEYRALRASVLRLWRVSRPISDPNDIDDVTRFNESIDQSLTEAVHAYTEQVERDRAAILANEQAARGEAEDANRAKDLFLAMLSHELRTPLNAIAGWVSILRSKGATEQDMAEGLNVIERSTNAQVQLIEEVLDVSRIVSGKMRMEIHACELTDIIKAGVNVVRPAAEAKNITLDVQLDPSASAVLCDAVRMQQVIWNLLSNSVKFTPKGGIVRLTLSREQSHVQIVVSDSGAGISADLLPYVFDRFRQADSSARRKFGGLGLGLSIVRHLVEAHGGTIRADSAGEGLGATFTICLPIKAVRIADAASKTDRGAGGRPLSPPPMRLDGLRVMIVDDDEESCRMLARALDSVGVTVITAASAADALRVLAGAFAEKNGPAVLVSDIGLPDQDGFELIRAVRKLGYAPRDLPAVALTAFAHQSDANKALMAGFQAYLSKPVDLHDLTIALAKLAGRTK